MAKKMVTAPDGAVTEVDEPVAEAPSEIEEVVSAPALDGEFVDMITVTVPHEYNLRLDNHHLVSYKAGVQEMERSHAEHFYSKAHGVVIYQK